MKIYFKLLHGKENIKSFLCILLITDYELNQSFLCLNSFTRYYGLNAELLKTYLSQHSFAESRMILSAIFFQDDSSCIV